MPIPPIIVIGMHRSGTSMLTDILENLGLFMGHRQNQNQESTFFKHLNVWLLQQAGAAWDHPEPIASLINDTTRRALFNDFLRHTLSTPRAVSFLGWGRYLRYRDVAALDMPWGWKDPRSTYTLPVWLDLFPKARVIHIYRNGVDVANSLRVRSQAGLTRFVTWKHPNRRLVFSFWNQLSPKLTVRHFSLDEGFALWEIYTRQANKYIAILPPEQTRVVQYEDFLTEPLGIMEDLCDFVGIPAQSDALNQAVATINPNRASAYEQDEELRALL